MPVLYENDTKEFHLFNDKVSYIMQILDNGQIGNLYFGGKITHKSDFSYLLEGGYKPLYLFREKDYQLGPGFTKLEYPCAGTGDFREPAFEAVYSDGSRITCMEYISHKIQKGKSVLEGLPATYTESGDEAETLEILLKDSITGLECLLSYTVFSAYPVIARNVRFVNRGDAPVVLERVLSASLDLPDDGYEIVHLAGAWARERHIIRHRLEQGVASIGSRKGISSAEHNPFIALVRPWTNESQGEAIGFSLVYSGNHIAQAEVDTFRTTRVQIGIHPDGFSWKLEKGQAFQSPEAVMVYSAAGLNGMSQTFHKLYRTRLARGYWRDRERPIVINNWEATGANFTEDSVLQIADTASCFGIELFVLDDGWFGNRDDDRSGLGDWYVSNFDKLPSGIEGFAEKVNALGMQFGLWFEPEMVNMDSDLYRAHPDWILHVPGREPMAGRHQYVLDFTREEVTETVFGMMKKLLDTGKIAYLKWDMNRYLSDVYSVGRSAAEQGMVYHKYVLGLYRLLERLIQAFPKLLIESCSSGGARFDPGMLYYAPQTWTSDDTDALERLKIQYGTSYVYPLSSISAHVSEIPNQLTNRKECVETRANVAMFGVFGYELDMDYIDVKEVESIAKQVDFVKKYRDLVQNGIFYRLKNPFEGNECGWIVVSEDQSEALAGYYRLRRTPNGGFSRMKLDGLKKEGWYLIDQKGEDRFAGDELMHAGIVIKDSELSGNGGDFSSVVYHIKENG